VPFVRSRPSPVRRVARLAVRLLGLPLAAVVLRLLRLTARRAGVAVVYHTVAQRTGEPRNELVPPHGVDLFDAQILHLRRKYRIVPAAELPAAAASRRRGARFPAAITFDDDLPEHVRFALPVLERHGATATFFLTGATLDAPYSFWWERLQRAIDRGAPIRSPSEGEAQVIAHNEIRRVGWEVEWLEPVDRARWADELLGAAGPDPADAGLRRDGVRRLAAAGMTIGFHTLHHPVLSRLSESTLSAALTDGRKELAAAARTSIDFLAYPHGQATSAVAAAAQAAPYAAAFATGGRPITLSSDRFLLQRWEPGALRTDDLAAAIALRLMRAPTAPQSARS